MRRRSAVYLGIELGDRAARMALCEPGGEVRLLRNSDGAEETPYQPGDPPDTGAGLDLRSATSQDRAALTATLHRLKNDAEVREDLTIHGAVIAVPVDRHVREMQEISRAAMEAGFAHPNLLPAPLAAIYGDESAAGRSRTLLVCEEAGPLTLVIQRAADLRAASRSADWCGTCRERVATGLELHVAGHDRFPEPDSEAFDPGLHQLLDNELGAAGRGQAAVGDLEELLQILGDRGLRPENLDRIARGYRRYEERANEVLDRLLHHPEGGRRRDVDLVVIVGPSAVGHMQQLVLQRRFGERVGACGDKHMVVVGAALYASRMYMEPEPATAFDYGVRCHDGTLGVIIPRGTPLPMARSVSRTFFIPEAGGRLVCVDVHHGCFLDRAEDNERLGQMLLDPDRPALEGAEVTVSMRIIGTEELTVRAELRSTRTGEVTCVQASMPTPDHIHYHELKWASSSIARADELLRTLPLVPELARCLRAARDQVADQHWRTGKGLRAMPFQRQEAIGALDLILSKVEHERTNRDHRSEVSTSFFGYLYRKIKPMLSPAVQHDWDEALDRLRRAAVDGDDAPSPEDQERLQSLHRDLAPSVIVALQNFTELEILRPHHEAAALARQNDALIEERAGIKRFSTLRSKVTRLRDSLYEQPIPQVCYPAVDPTRSA